MAIENADGPDFHEWGFKGDKGKNYKMPCKYICHNTYHTEEVLGWQKLQGD